jgi:ABC-2 type transport system permease protein
MTKASSRSPQGGPIVWSVRPAAVLTRRLEVTALLALFWLTLRQHCRARRLIIALLLFSLPCLLALLMRGFNAGASVAEMEAGLLFMVMPLLASFMALLYASGMIQDELEDQTLTYLLIRPLPKWGIYLVKLAATLLVTIVLTAVFAAATTAALYWGAKNFWGDVVPVRMLKTAAAFAVAQVCYCSLFGVNGVVNRRSLVAGVAYIVAFEIVLPNFDFAVRQATIMYYFRVISQRWLQLDGRAWAIDLAKAPSANDCILRLLAASLLFTVLAVLAFSQREFRVKTPDG